MGLPDLIAFDPEAGGTRELVALGEVLDDPSGDFIPSEGGIPLWYRLWASCGENVVRVHDRVRNQLRGFDGSGTEVRPIDLPPVRFTEVGRRRFAGAVFGLRQAELTGDVRIRLTAAVRCACESPLTEPFRRFGCLTGSMPFASRGVGCGVSTETKATSRPSGPSRCRRVDRPGHAEGPSRLTTA